MIRKKNQYNDILQGSTLLPKEVKQQCISLLEEKNGVLDYKAILQMKSLIDGW